MFDIFEGALDLMEGWNSRSRAERWLARIGCAVVVIMIVCFVLFIVGVVMVQQG